jgi:hypothetical protein
MLSRFSRALALLIALLPAVAIAQVPPFTLPPSTVIGRSAQGVGPAQAIPFASLIAAMLAGPVSIPTVNVNSVVFKGSVSGQATVQAQAAAGTPTISLPNASGTLADSALSPLVLDPVTGKMSCPTCAINGGTFGAASRAAAIALDLHTYGMVRTVGYAAGGDGGGALFKNVGSTPFVDSQVATGTVSANGTSGCTTGTVLGLSPTGGTGHGLQINYVVSGGVVTSALIVGNGGNGYSVGDVVSATVPGCAGSVNYTVSTITTPTGSFSDLVGTHFQIIVDDGNYLNARQFGAVGNWTMTGGDAAATNDTTAIQNMLNWAGNTVQPTVDGGGVAGQTVVLPFGNFLSNALTVPFGVRFAGQNAWSSQLKFADALTGAIIPITLCDPNIHLACFGTQISNMTLRAGSGIANSNIPMVFSNNLQQLNGVYRVTFYPGQRGCIQYDTGYGGAAWFGVEAVECTMSSTGNPGINFTNVGTTILKVKDSHAEFGSSGVSANGIQMTGGILDVDGFHTEGVSTGIFCNITGSTSNGMCRLHNLSGGAHCTNLVVRQNGSVANTVVMGAAFPNGCTNTISNAGSTSAAVQIPDINF